MRKPRLDLQSRREVADALWRLFCMSAKRVDFSFSSQGLTIQVPFTDEVDLDVPEPVVLGSIRDFKGYTE